MKKTACLLISIFLISIFGITAEAQKASSQYANERLRWDSTLKQKEIDLLEREVKVLSDSLKNGVKEKLLERDEDSFSRTLGAFDTLQYGMGLFVLLISGVLTFFLNSFSKKLGSMRTDLEFRKKENDDLIAEHRKAILELDEEKKKIVNQLDDLDKKSGFLEERLNVILASLDKRKKELEAEIGKDHIRMKNIGIEIGEKISHVRKSLLNELNIINNTREEIGEELSAQDYYMKSLSARNNDDNIKAIKLIDMALDIKNDYVDAWNLKGVTLSELNQNEKAIECFDRSLEIDPKDVDSLNNKGVVLVELNEQNEALQCFIEVSTIDPSDRDAFFNIACLYSLQQNKDKMLINLKTAIEIDAKLKQDARKDKDFQLYWNDPDFIALTKEDKT